MNRARYLAALLDSSRASGQTARGVLVPGLLVRVQTEPLRLCLYGQDGPVKRDVGEAEGRACAEALSWERFELMWEERAGRPLLVVSWQAPPPTPPQIDRPHLVAELVTFDGRRNPFFSDPDHASLRRAYLLALPDDELLAEVRHYQDTYPCVFSKGLLP